ncbi:hypothetical protein XELAEV_18031392mg [Xenopus laevis]|uniref:Uncharacterized protein n=1 Tax=Xenopus laevis TaxID=8355 RepID=A0A974CNP7_XENLA|nr:hypothetical protein XELAEV_18031392mg [Xenopus laevis]
MGRWLSFGGYYGKWFVPRDLIGLWVVRDEWQENRLYIEVHKQTEGLRLPQHCWREIPVTFQSEDLSKLYGWLENEAGRDEIMRVLLACQRALGVVTTEEADAETEQAASPSGSAASVLTAASLKKKAVHRKRPALPIVAVATVGEQVLPSYSGTSASGLIVSPSIPCPIFPSVFPTTTIDAIMPSTSNMPSMSHVSSDSHIPFTTHVTSASHVPSTSHVSATADAIQQVGTVQAVEAAKQSSSLSAVPIVHSQAESSSAEGTKDASILQLLGLHLSSLVKEKIIRGEYVDLLSLLPSAKEFLQTEKKGDSEEDRRRPVARTFTNWLQVFCIYCNILTEKYPGLAPKLLRHLDIVLEAYRSYGGVAWYIYDNRFRKKMTLSWGQKDVDLWMGMLMPRPLSNFSNQKSQVNAQGQSNAQNKYNTCWAYNESHYVGLKHECAQCGGAHPAFRFVKKF